MVEFETINSEDVKFGNNNFIEVSVKKAISEEGENVFFSLSRGFFTQEGEKRYKKNFSLPHDGETLKAVLSALKTFEKETPVQESAASADE